MLMKGFQKEPQTYIYRKVLIKIKHLILINKVKYKMKGLLQNKPQISPEFNLKSLEHRPSSIRFEHSVLQYDQLSTFRLIQSHNQEEEVRLLVEFMDILKQGLPDININFLYNAVFNSTHQNLLYIYREKVIGGICLKSSGVQYIKIEYFVVDAGYRQKGFGRLLMNVLKRLAQLRKVPSLVTHAAKNAFKFYQKQGFYETDSSEWKSRFEVFHNVVNLQCNVKPDLNYFLLHKNLQVQEAKIKAFLRNNFVDPQLYTCKTQKVNPIARVNEVTRKEEYFKANPELLPGIIKNGWSWGQYIRQMNTPETKRFRKFSFLHEIYQMAVPELRDIDNLKNKALFEFIKYREPIDIRRVIEMVVNEDIESESQVWSALTDFTHNASHLWAQNKPVLENINTIKKTFVKMKQKSQ